jgi:signal recognition particle receptor subunit beta
MKKTVICFTFIFSLLFIMVSNQKIYPQTETAVEGETGDADVSVPSNLKINYSELNALIDEIIFNKFMAVIRFIGKYLSIAWAFFLSLPPLIRNIIKISFFPACFGIISSHVIGIYKNRNKWDKHPYYDLMYSYFVKSGTLQRKESYRDAHALLRDHKWLLVSFAGLGFRLGNYANKSILLMFAMSFAYIPLSIIGFIEMVLRISFGTVWLLVCNLLHRLILFVTKLITYLLIPLSYTIDKIIRRIQYCPHCYDTFNLPVFVCPSCGRTHKQLMPGKCGVLFVRCVCNNIFLPCVSFTGRSRLASRCPACTGELAAANAKHFSLVVTGGDNVGKTAFIAAFSNLYVSADRHKHTLTIKGKPDNYFSELTDMFNSGVTPLDTESRTYSIIHKHGKIETDNLVFYKTFAEYVMLDKYSRSPKYFGFCDGIILIIDPLCVQSVKKELTDSRASFSPDDTNELVVQFIHQYNTICGFASGVMSNVPVVVLINKTDIEVINREIGRTTIQKLYNENPSAYNNSESIARDQICRAYLAKIGLINVLNNIEATFTNVSFFPVSAMGHTAGEGKAFAPVGVIEPVAWIAQKRRSRLAGLLSKTLINRE